MFYLALIFLSFSPSFLSGRSSPLSLIDFFSTEELESPRGAGVKVCESEPGRRCVHFTECDEYGFIMEDTSQISELDLRFGAGGDDSLCSEEMDTCCREKEQEIDCPSDFEPWENKCYHFSPSVDSSRHSVVYLSWNGAKAACEKINENATLPTVETAEENSFVNNKTSGTTFWLGAYRNYAADYKDQEWLSVSWYLTWRTLSSSVTAREQESWQWEDGRMVNFTAWAPSQPNNYWWGERCIRSLNLQTDTNTWDDHRCWQRTADAIVCQILFD